MTLYPISGDPAERNAALKSAAARTREVFDDIEVLLTKILVAHMRDEEAATDGEPLFQDREIFPLDLWPEGSRRRLSQAEAVAFVVDNMMSVLHAHIPDVRRAFFDEVDCAEVE